MNNTKGDDLNEFLSRNTTNVSDIKIVRPVLTGRLVRNGITQRDRTMIFENDISKFIEREVKNEYF